MANDTYLRDELSKRGFVSNALSARVSALLAKPSVTTSAVGAPMARYINVADSTGRGVGTAPNISTLNVVKQLAVLLRAAGIPASANSFYGAGGLALSTDSRFSWTGSTAPGSEISLGGPVINIPSGSTFTFTPNDGNVTSFIVRAVMANGLGSFTTKVDNGSQGSAVNTAQTLNGNTSQLRGGAAESITSGAHSITITASTATVKLIGIEAWDETRPEICLINAGWAGSASSDWNVDGANTYEKNSGYMPIPMLKQIAAPVVDFCLGINDVANASYSSTTPTSFKANMSALIAAAQVAGDVSLQVPWQSDPAAPINQNFGSWAALQQAIYDLAGVALPVVDNYAAIPYAKANAVGLMQDAAHPSPLGAAVWAMRRRAALLDMA